MIAAHLTAYRGLLGPAIQAVIQLRLVLLAGRFCFVERWPPRLSGLILNDRFRLLTAFPTLESEHLALYVSCERLTPDDGRRNRASISAWRGRLIRRQARLTFRLYRPGHTPAESICANASLSSKREILGVFTFGIFATQVQNSS